MKLKECSFCGEQTKLWRSKPPTCAKCMPKAKIKVNTSKVTKKIKESNVYYQEAIKENMDRNGECLCDNCGVTIPYPTGRNVSHIISKGANIALYYEKENNFILCAMCEDVWTNGDKTKMRIFPESKTRTFNLLNKYYLLKQ